VRAEERERVREKGETFDLSISRSPGI